MTEEKPWGVRMPGWLYLNVFGDVVRQAFGASPVLVGSALRTKEPNDVDVRLVLPVDEYRAIVGSTEEFGKTGTRWAALSLAFSALGREMTGRPVDFQIQFDAVALNHRDEPSITIGTGGGL